MASAASEMVQTPRLIVPGDAVIPKGRQKPEIVRGVTFILHMADGTDATYSDEDEVRMAPQGSETLTTQAVKEAKQRELEHADQAIEREQQHLASLEERLSRLEDLRAQREEAERKIAELQKQGISESEPTAEGE